MSKPIALLLDGDPYAFAGASASEVIHRFGPIYTNVADMDVAKRHVMTSINAVAKELRASKIINTLSCPSRHYWRHDVMPSYKGGRKEYKGPMVLEDLKTFMSGEFETERWDNMEADDILGVLATDPEYLPEYTKIVVSIDKDMKTLPDTMIYNPDKDYQPWFNSRKEADHFFLTQAIGGDTTDGYTGVIGMSVDTASSYLSDPWFWESYEHTFKSGPRKGASEQKWRKAPARSDPWENILSLFHKAGQTDADALANARVARICRHTDYDRTNQSVRLWLPEEQFRG
jgi:hypothetical protein